MALGRASVMIEPDGQYTTIVWTRAADGDQWTLMQNPVSNQTITQAINAARDSLAGLAGVMQEISISARTL